MFVPSFVCVLTHWEARHDGRLVTLERPALTMGERSDALTHPGRV